MSRPAPARPVLAEAVDDALDRGLSHFAPPGHKRDLELTRPAPEMARDITLLTGVEGQGLERGLIREAEAEVARAWHGDWARISVQGSTHGNLSLLLALGGPGTDVIVSRNAHRSTLGGLVLSGARPIWVEPDVDRRTGLGLGIRADAVREAARRSDRLAGIVVVDPSYMGFGSDLGAIREVADGLDVPLVVDAAWAAHFGFHPDLPATAMAAGAHAAVFSLHKTLPALTPASILVADGSGAIDLDRLGSAFDLLSTTSPPAAVQASADRARFTMESRGEELLDGALGVAAMGRELIGAIPGAICLGEETLEDPSVARWDPLKLVVDVGESGRSGYEVTEALRRNRVQVAYADERRLVALLTVADRPATIQALVDELEAALA